MSNMSDVREGHSRCSELAQELARVLTASQCLVAIPQARISQSTRVGWASRGRESEEWRKNEVTWSRKGHSPSDRDITNKSRYIIIRNLPIKPSSHPSIHETIQPHIQPYSQTAANSRSSLAARLSPPQPHQKIHSRNFSKAPLTTPLHRRLFRPNPKAAMFAPFVTPTLSRYPRTDQVQPL